MNYILTHEVVINGFRSERWETKIDKKDFKSLFNNLRKKFGRCIGKVYCDNILNKKQHIGWVFLKTVKQTDGSLNSCETWVSISMAESTKYVNPKTGELY